MSTKSTLAYGDTFHFYTDLMEGSDNVILEIHGCNTCNSNRYIEIPLHIWETIRKCSPMKFDSVDISDEDILKMVEKEVDADIAEYKADMTKYGKSWLTISGADEPREEQIKNGIERYAYRRTKQRKIIELMKDHKTYK
jgi:hypothetical protein